MASILFLGFIVLVVIGTPIAISLGLASMVAVWFKTAIPLVLVPQRMFTAADSFPLMAIPFFMLAGALMESGGISRRLINLANALVGHVRGGLAMVGVLTCMFFAAISGSGPATVAAVGSMMIPSMVRAGYDESFASAIMAISGSIGIVIPPSIPMVTYGVVAGASVGALFMGGFIPGILIGVGLMIYAHFVSKKRGYGVSDAKFSASALGKAFLDAIWAILMPVIILGGIYGGFFTPTEAAAVAVAYGFIVGFFVYKELKFKDLATIFVNAAVSTATVMLIIAAASVFGWILTSERIPDAVANAFISITQSPYVFMVLINILLLIVGTFMETNAAIIILAPIFLPLVQSLGINPVAFGVVMVCNLAVGMVTPPLGVNLFVACGIRKNMTIEKISGAVLPMIAINVAVILLLSFLPQLITFLPDLLLK
uniref:TRAP transporter large permease n=1 Tax=Ndongobacter massiliensis TaxID=1871025 RepID=UPI000930E6B7|nr:TRAP transporter large permease [Ndongobacter massiliensis]